MTFTEYKVIAVSEGALGTLFFGASGMPLQRLQETLNQEVQEGWQVVFQGLEKKRFLLFWTRESVIVTLGRE